jgi:hypothetical protein
MPQYHRERVPMSAIDPATALDLNGRRKPTGLSGDHPFF